MLKDLGYEVSVYTLTHKGRLAARLEASGIEVEEPPFNRVFRGMPRILGRPMLGMVAALSLWWRLVRLRRAIVHYFLPEAYLIGSLCTLAAGRKHIRVMSRRSLNRYQRKYALVSGLERALHRRMSAICGNSKAVISELVEEGAPQERVVLVYNGVDISRFEPVESREAIRARLDIPTGALVMTVVANLIPYKGHADLLDALAEIEGRLSDAWLMLWVGADSGIADRLLSKAGSLGLERRLRWLGRRQDVPEILQASDIGILCSHEEGFSNSVLEYMAASLPAIVTDTGGNAEAVVDGQIGRVVPVGATRDLAGAIVELASDEGLRERMGKAARRLAEDRFSISDCVSGYDRLYRRLWLETG